ncbi:MAG: M42 family metallopeptidase [Anaerolineales bacterium]
MKDLIRDLVEAWGPSGFEHHVRAYIREQVADLADEMRVDAMGNLICRMGEKHSDGLRVMVAAHMDEIGVMVSHIDDNGFARFTNIGGVNQQHLHGLRVMFENGLVGVVYAESSGDRGKIPGLNGFYIDAQNGEAETPIKVGDPANFWRQMDERGSRLTSKAMDDRIGCAVAIETMRRLKDSPHEVYFAFTVQEEVGLRGATTAGYSIYPDLAIALDVTLTGDTPKGPMKMAVELGKGTAIKALDGRHIAPPAVRELLVRRAEAHNIPYQIEILSGGTTDAAAIQLAQSGVPAGTISIPCRYVHSPSETVDLNDVQASVDLLVAALSEPITGIQPE